MDGEFVNLTPEDIGSEHLCCVIRLKTAHPGVETKRAARRAVRPCGHARRGKIPALCVQQPGGVLWRKACRAVNQIDAAALEKLRQKASKENRS